MILVEIIILFGSLVNVTNVKKFYYNFEDILNMNFRVHKLHVRFSGDHMIGVGITMEGINQNEIMYEFALEQSWRSPLNETELNDW